MRRRLIIAGCLALVLAGSVIGLRALYWHWRVHRFDREILAAARHHHVDPRLVAALIWRETRFNPDREGRRGEIGLMQVMPAAGHEWAAEERIANYAPQALYHPATNILAGTWYLARALKRWQGQDDPVACAVAEYNAGPANAQRWAAAAAARGCPLPDAITYPATRQYVLNITRGCRSGRWRFAAEPEERGENR